MTQLFRAENVILYQKIYIFAVFRFFHPVSCFSLDTLLWFSPWEETPKLSEIFSPKNSISNDSLSKPLFSSVKPIWLILMIHNFFIWRIQRWTFLLKNFGEKIFERNSFFIKQFVAYFFRFESSFETFEFFWFLGYSRKSERLGHFEVDDLSDS